MLKAPRMRIGSSPWSKSRSRISRAWALCPEPIASKIFHMFSARLLPTSLSTSALSMRLAVPT